MAATTDSTTGENSDAIASQQDQLLGHAYDGIQEYDNPLPGWWTFLFWVFIVFAPIYLLYYNGGMEGRSIYDAYQSELAANYELKFKEIGNLSPDRATILEYLEKEEWLAVGKAFFQTNCISCHGANAGGGAGPNLTDDYWKNTTTVEGIARVIAEGAGNGAMPAWKSRMTHPNQLVLTAAYVASLRGKEVPGGKPPEGKIVPPWNE